MTVLLSGEGADEVFGGYTRFLRRAPADRSRHSSGPRNSSRRRSWRDCGPAPTWRPPSRGARRSFNEGGGDHLSNCLKYDMQTYLVDLLVRQDKMTMAHGVENRVPFLDRRVVDFARTLPAEHLVDDSAAPARRLP